MELVIEQIMEFQYFDKYTQNRAIIDFVDTLFSILKA